MSKNKSVLVISDLHCPYMHQDALKFLKAVKKKYKPDRVIQIGDELDNHGISFHDADPDLDSAGVELIKARKQLTDLEKIFPVMDIVHSNHGSLLYRKGKAHGIPKHMLLGYKDVIFGEKNKQGEIVRKKGDGWNWYDNITLELSNGEKCFFVHQAEANIANHAGHFGMSIVAGHRHSKFELGYISSPHSLRFGMVVGCLLDHKSLAFEYNKLQSKRPILGVGVIIEGIPILVPMLLNSEGRWVGKI